LHVFLAFQVATTFVSEGEHPNARKTTRTEINDMSHLGGSGWSESTKKQSIDWLYAKEKGQEISPFSQRTGKHKIC